MEYTDLKLYRGNNLVAELDSTKTKMIYNAKEVLRLKFLYLYFGLDKGKYEQDVNIFLNIFLPKRLPEEGSEDTKIYLKHLGFLSTNNIDKLEVVKRGNAKMLCDDFWVDFGEGEIYFG